MLKSCTKSVWATLLLAIVALAGAPGPATAADWIGDYFNCILGTTWVFEDVDNPGATFTESVFEYIEYEGHWAVRLGADMDNHNLIANTGHVISVFAEVDEGVFTDLAEDFVLAEFHDGSYFSFCPSGVDCDSSLIRVWTELDPSLRSIYGIDPVEADLVVFASYDRDYDRNLHNTVLESNLPDGIEPPAGAVTGIEWFRWKTGTYAIIDIDAESGGVTEHLRLIEFTTPVSENEIARQPVVLEQNYPNPFNPITTLSYELHRQSPVSLCVYDCTGRRLKCLYQGHRQEAGRYTVQWHGRDDRGRALPSGTYLLRLETGTTTLNRSLTLLR